MKLSSCYLEHLDSSGSMTCEPTEELRGGYKPSFKIR
jgi:hypothetical protein